MDRLAAGRNERGAGAHARERERSTWNKRVLSYRYVAFKETVNAVVDDILRNYALYAVVRREHARARPPGFFVSRKTLLCTD